MTSIPKTSSDIRSSFIQYFESKEHQFIRSAPVAPQDDPTLMFTNAGMNQFKSIFLGDNPKGLKRAANSQKCIRVSGKHNDLEEVGKDTYHHTLFEMLGNWSFGDYYKKEAIEFAWEYLTEVLKLEKERIFVTVFEDDDEAEQLWLELTGIDKHRVMRFGKRDNFWEMGEVGPCGPCSEIHYDKGDLATQEEFYKDEVLGVNGENDRFIEIWNLVFIQYERIEGGDLKPLKNKHVDTGMGFERLCAILQGVHSNYDTDIFTPIIEKIVELSGVKYDQGEGGVPHRVIADHLRTVAFAIADGVMPSNDGRGYVIRRILRRASKYSQNLGNDKAFIYQLIPTLVENMGKAFPELAERQDFITQLMKAEEERFLQTLGRGLVRFEKIVSGLEGKKEIPGEQAFELYDTYGFPFDLTRVLAEEKGLTVDEVGFDEEMKIQKQRGKDSVKDTVNYNTEDGWVVYNSSNETEFLGYETHYAEGVKINKYRVDEDVITLVLNRTPFYAESGGQIGDAGLLSNESVSIKVFDTIKVNEAWIHKAKKVSGDVSEESMSKGFTAEVDNSLRADTKRNHTATHILHAALRNVLGEHVAQQGSRVAPDGLRFDFSHFQGLSAEELQQIEEQVNEKILENIGIDLKVQDLEEAKKGGAMALFGEKYDEKVRVISIGKYSTELCGGLHVSSTGEIGSFKILSEVSTAAGVRRIEAVTGKASFAISKQNADVISNLQSKVKCKPEQLGERVDQLISTQKKMEKELEALKQKLASQQVSSLLQKGTSVAGVNLIVHQLNDGDDIGAVSDALLAGMDSGVGVLGVKKSDDSGSIAVVVTKDLISKIKAGNLVKEVAQIAGGRGGGRPDRAQAGTKEPNLIPNALKEVPSLLEKIS